MCVCEYLYICIYVCVCRAVYYCSAINVGMRSTVATPLASLEERGDQLHITRHRTCVFMHSCTEPRLAFRVRGIQYKWWPSAGRVRERATHIDIEIRLVYVEVSVTWPAYMYIYGHNFLSLSIYVDRVCCIYLYIYIYRRIARNMISYPVSLP